MKTQQSGFTLIELVMVIVILGILAATALPKFVDLSSGARAGTLDAVRASMMGANAIIYAQSALEGEQADATGSVTLNGSAIATVYGYAEDAQDLALAMDLDGFTAVVGGAATGTDGGIQADDATAPSTCEVTYVNAAGATTLPVYTVDAADCS